MTKKLYYEDSHQTAVTQRSCPVHGMRKQCYEVVLNQTVFFPEGGGQYADTGSLGGVNVLDRGRRYLHSTGTELPRQAGVDGTINYKERFSKMQQHTGEHIVSGIVHRTPSDMTM